MASNCPIVSSTEPALAFANDPLGNSNTTRALLYVGGSVLLQVSQATMPIVTVSLATFTSILVGYTLSPFANNFVVCSSWLNLFLSASRPFFTATFGG